MATVGGDALAAAAEAMGDVGARLVERAGVAPGMEVLDVGTGTGNAALAAGKAGAGVTGLDRAPELLAVCGHMFAPDQRAVAAELLRVCRPGGALGLCAWTPEGLGGRMLAAIARHLPPPAAYDASPAAWGDEQRLRELVGGAIEVERGSAGFSAGSPEAWFAFVAESVEPFVAAGGELDERRRSAVRDELVELFRDSNVSDDGAFRVEQEYLLAVVRL